MFPESSENLDSKFNWQDEIKKTTGLFFDYPTYKHDVPPEIMPALTKIMIGKIIYGSFDLGANQHFNGVITDVMLVKDKALIEMKDDEGKITTLEDNYLPGFFPNELLEEEMAIIFPRPGSNRAVVKISSEEMISLFKKLDDNPSK